MKKSILLFVLFFSFTTITVAQVDPDYSKTLKEMFEVSGTEDSYKTMITQMFTVFKQQYPDVKPELWSELEGEFLSTSLNDLVVMLVPVYQKYMTKEDLEEIIVFYQTPTGKKFAANTPLIIQGSMQVGQQWGLEVGQEFEKKN